MTPTEAAVGYHLDAISLTVNKALASGRDSPSRFATIVDSSVDVTLGSTLGERISSDGHALPEKTFSEEQTPSKLRDALGSVR